MRSIIVFAFLALLSSSATGQESSAVSVVHGIPGVTVDVYVNGVATLPGFAPGTVAGPLELPAASYRVQIVASGETDLGQAVIDRTVEVPGGQNLSLAAHLTAAGAPELTAFVNDVSELGTGRGRVILRHAAAAPVVDVLLLKRWWPRAFLNNLENGQEGSAVLFEGEYSALVLGGKRHELIAGPLSLPVTEGGVLIVYAIGSLADGTFGVVTQALSANPPPASVTVVHGVPGLTVDVYVNGQVALPDFAPKTITDPIELPPGKYAIAIAPAGAGIAAAVIQTEVELASALDASIVAHLGADGAPTASVFVDDLSCTGFGKGRVVVRHTAAAPAVDIRLTRRGKPAGELAGIANGTEGTVELHASRYQVSVYPAGGADAVLGPASLKVRPATATTIYAIGALADGSLELISQERKLSLRRCLFELLRR